MYASIVAHRMPLSRWRGAPQRIPRLDL